MAAKRDLQRGQSRVPDVRTLDALLRMARQAISVKLEPLFKRHQLNYSQWVVLGFLEAGVAKTAAEIARLLVYDNGSLTRLIDTLENRGLVARERDKEDRRIVWLILTPNGVDLLRSTAPAFAGALESALAKLSGADRAQLGKLLRKIVDAG